MGAIPSSVENEHQNCPQSGRGKTTCFPPHPHQVQFYQCTPQCPSPCLLKIPSGRRRRLVHVSELLQAVERLLLRERLAFPCSFRRIVGLSSSLLPCLLYHRCPYSCPLIGFWPAPRLRRGVLRVLQPPQRSWCRQCRVWLDAAVYYSAHRFSDQRLL
jgi:hypothetical protein